MKLADLLSICSIFLSLLFTFFNAYRIFFIYVQKIERKTIVSAINSLELSYNDTGF